MREIEFPLAYEFLWQPARYKVPWGGRGSAKSWSIARALVILGRKRQLRILCCRETMKSIATSVYQLLVDQIRLLGLEDFYDVQQATIIGRNGTQFFFFGLRHDIDSVKSTEGIDICWVEEAQTVSPNSWQILIPTIRKEGSELWVSFNPDLESDATYQRFVINPPPDARVVKVSFRDNPWFPETLRREMEHCRATNPEEYHHVWEGHCKSATQGAIYAEEIRAAEKEERIASVPYDAAKPVLTFWDLGFGDATSIWLAQAVGREYHVIDFIEGVRKPLNHYLRELQERPYIYGTFYLPHDARAHELGTGRSIEELIRESGRQVQVVRKLSIADGINAARTIFGQCWFDQRKTEQGMNALRHYRYAENDKLSTPEHKVYAREPLHDWASHAADAFRAMAVAIQAPEREANEARQHHEHLGDDAWMD